MENGERCGLNSAGWQCHRIGPRVIRPVCLPEKGKRYGQPKSLGGVPSVPTEERLCTEIEGSWGEG
jgi:hypothetical protein